ncbi:PA2169 family four-helix-bundle protein [Pseudomonas typographi]|uniref:PA2169 family four-helix-bundle protein n=1 Tax=Pseudomonas typographi TaxID=2715964 RepID=A0ABR7YXD0_9PSED|nr:PA2169 family four-helix-bundle protein [Pseudomonas typographi]MBD1550952.1 PA2169 family four-helix-bundle protein [Pseudomonas typographi]MBD1585777.1 PA2169 family four-helix-bundle protein [Pseudomonas typographi]MBD1597851.1 PA2169 family four-helix-bundle protein [Pseudomonas typographi]
MTDSVKDTIKVLNNLIETSKDGQEGFKTCAEDVKNAELKALFIKRAEECSKAAGELQAAVTELGGSPEDSTSVVGDIHRYWVDLKSRITGQSEEAILNEAERGEDAALKAYKEALAKPLPANVYTLIERQFHGVQRNHDQIKALRNIARAS